MPIYLRVLGASASSGPFTGIESYLRIAKLGDKAASLAPDLIGAIEDQWRNDTKVPILRCLAALGPAAKEALPLLERLRDDPNPRVADAAEDVIRRIKGD